MSDLGSFSDFLGALRDIFDRIRAPKRIEGRTRCFLERSERLGEDLRALSDSTLSNVSDTSNREVPHLNLPTRGVNLIAAHRDKLLPPIDGGRHEKLWKAYQFAKVALRRDKLFELCNEIETVQNNEMIDHLVVGQAAIQHQISKLALQHEFLHKLHPCTNIEDATRLHVSAYAELDGLSKQDKGFFHPICQESGALPIWGRALPAQEVFADNNAISRFNVLLAVANALVVGERASWFHQRLSTDVIVVRSDCLPGADSNVCGGNLTWMPGNEDVFAKVLHFRCPITLGCVDGCPHCEHALRQAEQNVKKVAGLSRQDSHRTHQHSWRRPQVMFSRHPDAIPIRNARNARIHNHSFASFVIWLFSGYPMTDNFDHLSDLRHAEQMAYVPWPLRWLIVDRHSLSMSAVVAYLQALQERRINPHVLTAPLMQPPNQAARKAHRWANREEPTTETNYKMSGSNSGLHIVLYDCALRSARIGAQTEEPQAAVHVGQLLEDIALRQRADIGIDSVQDVQVDINLDAIGSPNWSLRARSTLTKAYECYAHAGSLGEPMGFVRMARLQAEWLHGEIPRAISDVSVSLSNMLHLLLEAAVSGDDTALSLLEQVPRLGVVNVKQLFQKSDRDSIKEDVSKAMVEDRLLDVVVKIGKAWRRGDLGLPVDRMVAGEWLWCASGRGRPDATLELGLLLKQTAHTAAELRGALGFIRQASNMRPTPAGFTACYWMGIWQHTGLTWPPGGRGSQCHAREGVQVEVVLQKDNREAAKYLLVAAESGHADAMAMYSRMARLGLVGAGKSSEQEAAKWNEKAREHGSIIAFCASALDRVNDAMRVYSLIKSYERDDFEPQTIPLEPVTNEPDQHVPKLRMPKFHNNTKRKACTNAQAPNQTTPNPSTRIPSSGSQCSTNGSSRSTSTFSFAFWHTSGVGSDTNGSVGDNSEKLEMTVDRNAEFVDPMTGRYKPAAVQKLLDIALKLFMIPPLKFKDSCPEQAMNPLPYLLAAKMIMGKFGIWSSCASCVVKKVTSRDSFINDKKRQAFELLHNAATMEENARWKWSRVDYPEDLNVIREAKEKLSEWFPNGIIHSIKIG